MTRAVLYLTQLTRFVSAVGILSCLLLISTTSISQDLNYGELQGDIADSLTSNPIVNAEITFRNTSTETRTTVKSDSEGRLSSGKLPAGIYEISIIARNYKPRLLLRTVKAGVIGDIIPVPVNLDPESLRCNGLVYDTSTDLPISGASVEVQPDSTGIPIVIRTNHKGEFNFDTLPIEPSSIHISATGYTPRSFRRDLLKAASSPKKCLGVTLLDPQIDGPKDRPASFRIDFGVYYALVIGNDDYRLPISKLSNAVRDASAVAQILKERYGFKTKLMLNAKGDQIVGAVNEYKRVLTENDNLRIYYAGHGVKEEDEAYWIPVDATDAQDNTTWVSSTIHVIKNLKSTKAKHVLVVSDSCFAGAIDLRQLTPSDLARPTERERFLQTLVNSRSRVLIASGGDEPVLDGGAGKNSIFTKAFLNGLEKMEPDVFTAGELFSAFIQQQVSGNAKQTPEFKSLRDSGHQKGDFVFVRR